MATAKKATQAAKSNAGKPKKAAPTPKKAPVKTGAGKAAVPTKASSAKTSAAPPKKAAPAPKKAAPAPKKAAPAPKKAAPAPKKAAAPVKKAARAATAKKSPVKKAAPPAKPPAAKAPAAKAPSPKTVVPVKKALPAKKPGKVVLDKFQLKARDQLIAERATYLSQAQSLRAEADQIALEAEPGDIQFDDESGEGGTMAIDRERDLALASQAMVIIDEIDHSLRKLDFGTYGLCENCGQHILKARLEALPYARLCMACKSGGLSRR